MTPSPSLAAARPACRGLTLRLDAAGLRYNPTPPPSSSSRMAPPPRKHRSHPRPSSRRQLTRVTTSSF
ncbi:hypothetical protein PR202_gb11606 [Eleusine coracana subsp. coracana]|uniref:Uncharacterized protein n=1 Tax=Eleusine coracana subsp. coracana TaxID=191504 RepID=A0AAV5EMZ1_ELECO|nr:hypothetical protein PR202_gb11606 [Eleusine coracana subsp. coracana]